MTVPNTDAMSNSSFPGVANNSRHVHRSRTTSFSSDRPSTIGHSLMSPPLSVSPQAAFIAASAASQIVTNDHDSHSETWYDQVGLEPSGETALVSPGALQLGNNFIDQLLFNILAVARATNLAAVRPAVSEVLKPKLAKDAINQADEELREYLGGGEVEALAQSPREESPRDWDLELVWKRTRLRCMVYSSLGDMEDEDEDYFMEQDHLIGESDDHLSEVVSPAVAIFLTSILEFMGEQVLVVSGQAAFNRLRIKYEKEMKDGTRSPEALCERIVVEELDMERVALDRTLGRLWRSWKKRIRSPVEPARPFPRSTTHSRHGSTASDIRPSLSSPKEETETENGRPMNEKVKQQPRPSSIPLPMSNNDVAEIEVPGLVSYSDEESSENDEEEDAVQRVRPKSLMLFSLRAKRDAPAPDLSHPHTPTQPSLKRANSLPSVSTSPYKSPKPSKAQVEAGEPGGEDRNASKAPEVVLTDADPTASIVSAKEDDRSVSSLATELDSASQPKATLSPMSPVSPVSNIVSGAVMAGTAAVAGVAAMAQGSAVQTEVSPLTTPLEEDDIDGFDEEPQILTSSRVSIGGRSSPSASDSGGGPTKPPSIVPVRSNSVRSLRVIEVPPRSPVVWSRSSPTDVSDYISTPKLNGSREGSISTPPIVEEGDHEAPFAIAMMKNGVSVPSRGTSREGSPVSLHRSMSASYAKSPAPTSMPIVASSGPTKVMILSTSTSGGTFLDTDTRPEVPQKSPSHMKQPSLPAVPERNINRGMKSQPPAVARSQSVRRASPESSQNSHAVQNDSPTSSTSTKFKAVPSSEDSSRPQPEDMARNFEELLQNDQTLQYTLTPENMRDMDSVRLLQNGSPVVAPIKPVERSRSSSLARSVSVSRAIGLSSHPPTDFQPGSKLTGPVPRAPPVSMSPKSRFGAAAQARDARVPRDSINDFAEFIRSTGPAGERSRAAPTHARNVSVPIPMNSSMDYRQPGSVNRARLQARDAHVSSNNESSELIDFIRRGPPSNGSNPRIPRIVAPFRTTMDSDQLQMSGAGGGRAVDAMIPDVRNSQASTNVTENSVQSSINSQSALLSKANRPAQYSNNFEEEDMFPKRKQRRVRDPYEIDFSDADDDFEVAPKPKSNPRKEESLIDFLSNYQPPPDPSPPQPFINSQSVPKKKASAPNLISRLRSAGSISGSTSASSRNGTNAADSRYLSNRATITNNRNYTPISVSIPPGAEKYNNLASGSPRVSTSNSSSVLRKKFEPRDAVSSANRTNDLSSFFKNSEPPPSSMTALASPIGERSTGFSRMFERRRKGSAF